MSLAFDETVEESFGGLLIARTLEKNIKDIAVQIDRLIQIASLSLDAEKSIHRTLPESLNDDKDPPKSGSCHLQISAQSRCHGYHHSSGLQSTGVANGQASGESTRCWG